MPPPAIRLAEVVGALSLAADLGNGQAPELALKMALVAHRLAQAQGADESLQHDVYWCSLLRFLGCTAFAVEEAALSAGDDLGLRRAFMHTDFGHPAEVLHAVVFEIGRDAPLARRAASVARFVASPSAPDAHAHAQCDAGQHFARKLGLPTNVVAALADVEERYDGRGAPGRKRGDAIAEAMRHVEAARVAVLFHGRGGVGAARRELARRAGGHLDPALARALADDAPSLLAPLDQPSVWDEALTAEPAAQRMVRAADLPALLEAFALFADLSSAHTLGHAAGVANLAGAAAAVAGLPAPAVDAVRQAGLVHDLGRVAVPAGVWDKPGALNTAEWERVRLHAYHGERVLRASPALAPLAEWVGHSHERLDGSGYHRGEAGGRIGRPARLIAAADCYHACLEHRAHRPALARRAAEQVLRDEARQGRLCAQAVDAVLAAAGHAHAPAPAKTALSARETEVLALLARGLSNKLIARELGISARTVQHHTISIYAKAGVASRAGAVLFAFEQGLLGRH